MSLVDYSDVQGLTAFGYGKLVEACYLLVRIRNVSAARDWCSSAPVSTAEPKNPPPRTSLQIGFTSHGLRALQIPERILAGFSPEFRSGMAGDESRSRRLGDIGVNHPSNWVWGGSEDAPDMVAMLFATHDLETWKQQVLTDRWDDAFETVACLSTSNMGDKEPFGFRDGISQPEIDWNRTRTTGREETEYTNLIALGEFLLGYPNEYGKYTDRPLLDSADDPAGDLPPAEDDSGRKDLGRNGTYFVLRQLDQDVRGFWQFLDRTAKGDPKERDRLGAAMVGRARDGQPLVTDTTFDGDPGGVKCPLAAHIRRANPRNADLFGHPSGLTARLSGNLGIPQALPDDDRIASTRFHRILRRGREYGTLLSPDEALQPAPSNDPPRGLHFGCIGASIARQFEFVQNAWIMSTKFNGLTEESDPLLGNRAKGENFSIPHGGKLREVVTGIPQFVMVRGGAYFFLPGISALRYLAQPLNKTTEPRR